MRVGVRVETAWTIGQQLEYVREAERLGFDIAWVEGNAFKSEPFSTAGYLAAQTSRIELGVAIAAVYMMHPVLIASAAATLDDLTGGRFIMGLGCSSVLATDRLGLDTRPLQWMREGLACVRALLAGGPASYEGEVFSLRNVSVTRAKRPLPLFVAAEGPKMQELAGELGDGWIIATAGDGYNQASIRAVEAGLAKSGRARASFRSVAYTRLWTLESPSEELPMLRPVTSRLLARISPAAWKHMGIEGETARRIAGDPGAAPESLIRELIFTGDREAVARRARELAAQGFDELVLESSAVTQLPMDTQYQHYSEMMRRFGEQVLPELR